MPPDRLWNCVVTGWRICHRAKANPPALILVIRRAHLFWHCGVPGGSGSHLAASLARAEAFALVPADVSTVAVGDPLDVMLIS